MTLLVHVMSEGARDRHGGRRDVLQVRIESELAQDRGGMLPPVLGGALIGHGRQAAGVLDCESSQAFTAEAR